jgi:hypothetical protein
MLPHIFPGLLSSLQRCFEPRAVLDLQEREAGDHPCEEGNPEIDENALSDLPDGDIDNGPPEPEPGWKMVIKT